MQSCQFDCYVHTVGDLSIHAENYDNTNDVDFSLMDADKIVGSAMYEAEFDDMLAGSSSIAVGTQVYHVGVPVFDY